MENKLRFLRDRNNLFKTDVARYLGVSSVIYSKWEQDLESIPIKRLIELADLYEVSIDYLICLSNTKKKIKHIEFNDDLVARRTKEVRKELKLTQEQIAELLNTTHSTWSAYESGKTLILGSFIYPVCSKSGISADYLLGRSNIKYINK